jgi:hypothetical protein
MPIVVIVEDGSNVPDANAFVSVSDVKTYAEHRGLTLPTTDDGVASLIIRSTDYINSKECEFQGVRTYVDQELSWPRTGVFINCQEWPADAIPKALTAATVMMCVALNEGFDPWANVNAAENVIEDTVGPITTRYSDAIAELGGVPSVSVPAFDALLAPLTKDGCYSGGLRTVRV